MPLKQYIVDSFVALRPDACVVQQFFLKKSIIELDDDLIGLVGSTTSDYFYQLSNKETFMADTQYGPGPGVYFNQKFKLDASEDVYTRQVYNLAGVLTTVGGFRNALYYVGLFLYARF